MKLVKTLGLILLFAPIYLVNENGYFEGDSDGDKLKIHNNRRALNPTYDGLMDFLERNTIDERDYEYPTYTCGNFATDLHDAAEKEFFHAFNVFKTVDTTSQRMNTIIITKQNDGEMMFKPIVC